MSEEEPKRTLDEIRREIDKLDDQLVALLNLRVSLAQEVGHVKGKEKSPYFTPERERQIYAKLETHNPGPLQNRQLAAIYREVISAARCAEKPLEVGYWGPEGTFSHLAAIETFGRSTEFKPFESIQDVFLAAEHGHVDYGIVPIENSTAGVVPETLDVFPQTNLRIVAETFVPIQHHLVSIAEKLDDVQRVYTGPQPAGQCRRWLKLNLPHAEIVEVAPTAKAAQRAIQDPDGAAIANSLCIEIMGLPVLADHIEDNPENRTRFVVLGYNEPKRTGRDKTSLLFSLRNRPGELYTALGAFVSHGVNLMMIESRPAPRSSFEYVFYVDCAGHRSDPAVKLAIQEIRKHALETIVLGSYPSTDPNLLES